jgi:hypothetical protein
MTGKMCSKRVIAGPIVTAKEVPEIVRREVQRLSIARAMQNLEQPANLPTVEFDWDCEKPEGRNQLDDGSLLSLRIYEYGDSMRACKCVVVKNPKRGLRDVIDLRSATAARGSSISTEEDSRKLLASRDDRIRCPL